MNTDDKLVISGLSVFHYILKYYRNGFSRSDILRMHKRINVHNSLEMNHIINFIISDVLYEYVRRIGNSPDKYRFSFLFEQETYFITTINEGGGL